MRKLATAAAALSLAATPGLSVRPRGLIAVRGEADAAKILTELNRTFEEFKASNDNRIKALEKRGAEDVLDVKKVEAINAEITALKSAMDLVSQSMAALKIGAAANDQETPEGAAYKKAFNKWFRRGDPSVQAELQGLAVKAALTSDSDPDGGYTVPKEMSSTIDRILAAVSAMRGIATVQPVGTKSYQKLVSVGGAGSGWVGETEARPITSAASLKLMEFPVMEIYANPAASQTVLDDSGIDLATWLGNEVAITLAEQEGAAFITGNGVNKPRGILAYPTLANASYAWGSLGYLASGVASALTDSTHDGISALLDVIYGLKQGYRLNSRWIMNRGTQGTIRKIKDANGQYLWQPPITAGQPASLLGYPVTDDDNMNDIGTNTYPVAFGDFARGYLIVDRIGIRVLRDPFTAKPYVLFYTTKRVGGGVQNFEAIKLLKIASS